MRRHFIGDTGLTPTYSPKRHGLSLLLALQPGDLLLDLGLVRELHPAPRALGLVYEAVPVRLDDLEPCAYLSLLLDHQALLVLEIVERVPLPGEGRAVVLLAEGRVDLLLERAALVADGLDGRV